MKKFKEQLYKNIISSELDKKYNAPAYAIVDYVVSKMYEFSEIHNTQREKDKHLVK